ncbi:transaldolase [Tautonia plasticadhaerens]|uniref:Transaldolase n=1 Tax=Tautonia plasticadhaerens TaxID=2527974 RepID=A0A518HB88_9BACT|nr:transaldolase [Tautonia plasticadhaerens]QDV38120.1 Transaldolase [Tautonia plasticadhaerens]
MATAAATPLTKLQALKQSVWMDFMSRQFVRQGELARLIEDDGLQGATSNPTIFEKAIGHSADYDDDTRALVAEGADVDHIYEALVVEDIRGALDLFRPVYDRTDGLDGYVSLEVSPLLALEREKTATEAKHYWGKLDRPNAMIKIPGTEQCVPAIEDSLADGLNINVTLLFSVEAYEAVAHAYIRALRRRVEAGRPIDHVASVASFFVSRIDAEVDGRLDAIIAKESDAGRKAKLEALKGKAAIANAKIAYESFGKIFSGPEWQALAAKGAKPQRLLWASVGTKNPSYPDTLYIDELIGPDTVSTMPPETYQAFRDHGRVVDSPPLTADTAAAHEVMADLAGAGVDFKDVTDHLLKDGVQKFAKSFDDLLGAVRGKREQLAK